jgi:hypothetical protein
VSTVDAVGYWPLDRPFPALLTPAQLMDVMGLRKSRFYELQQAGVFRALEAAEIDRRMPLRYSGVLVQRYCAGSWTSAQTFGRRTQRSRDALVSVPVGAVAVR